jgi:U3 small nucleolar RNA-associated protein 4
MVGRILLKGEANINSASISRDGHLLVVGTATEVKAFRLGWMDDTVRIRRLKNLPSRWNRGASVVQVSPDSCWVCVVQEGGQPSLVRVESVASDAETTYSFPSTPTKLKRLVRPSRQARTAATLGPYDRTITHAAFSADSRILAVADLSGSIDTWILGTNGEHGKNGTAESHSSGSSSEEWEENNLPETGVCWRANPRARLLPRLPSAPVVLSFSGELPLAENDYTLLTVTASGKVIVLNPLSGSITDWSRRNPTSRLPEEFRLSRDILKGVVWQGSRAWLYGVSSLFMLDLSTDFDDTVTSKAQTQPSLDSQVFGKKRKRGNNSGAGDKTARGALATGRVHPTDGNSDEVRLDSRKMHNGSSTQNGDEHDSIDDQDMLRLRQSQKGEEAEVHDAARQNFWFTYKYRPILGLVPLEPQRSSVSNGGLGQNDGKPRPIEVVLVERPQWEVDLPPRYLGKNEYER